MMTKKGILTNIILIILAMGLTVCGYLFKIWPLLFIPIPVVLLYFIMVKIAVKFYEKQIVQLNRDTKEFQDSLNLGENDEIVYLNETEFKKFRKEGKLYRGKNKEPMVLGDNVNDHTEKLK